MRSLLDAEEEEETTAREITLSTASLLGIFFGLVLVCGVFFGFGYSLGRGTAWVSQSKSVDSPSALKDDVASVTPPPPAGPEPAATEQTETPQATTPTLTSQTPEKQVAESVPEDTPAPPV